MDGALMASDPSFRWGNGCSERAILPPEFQPHFLEHFLVVGPVFADFDVQKQMHGYAQHFGQLLTRGLADGLLIMLPPLPSTIGF